jgi:hypothetical protein
VVSSDLASIDAAYINLGDIGLIPTAELKKYGCRTARLPLSDEKNFIH